MSESKQRKKLLLKKKLADDIESSKLIQNYNVINARSNIKRLTALSKFKKNPASQSQTITQESFAKKEEVAAVDDTMPMLEDPLLAEVAGPQLRLNKNTMSFIEKTGNMSKDNIVVTNNGSTAIYYKWKRLEPQAFFSTTLLDKEERFFCHSNKNVIKPGEIRTFYFTFKSRTTGIFEEDWQLECEPPLITPLPPIKLCGHAIEDDPHEEWRSEIDMIMNANHKYRFVGEILNDIVGEVRTPTPPLPDLDDPEVCKREFEEKNARYHLYYTPLVMNLFRNLQKLVYDDLYIDVEDPAHYWDLDVDYLREKISLIKDDFNHDCYLRRYWDLFKLAKRKPIHRSTLFNKCKKIVESIVLDFDDASNNLRRERDIWEYHFQEPVDLTEDELKKRKDEEAKMKAEFYKKVKKKPKNDDEEKKNIDDYKKELGVRIGKLLAERMDTVEKSEVYIRSLQELQTRPKPDKSYFEILALKKTMKDLDMNIEGRRILIRVHLEKKEPAVFDAEWQAEVLRFEAEAKAKEEAFKAELKKTGKKPPKKSKEEIAEEARKQKEDEERRRFVLSIEEKSLYEVTYLIRFLLEQLAKQVMVLVSYGDSHGRNKPGNSTRPFWEYMKTQIEQMCVFEESCRISDILEKHEMESYPDNSCVILENAFNEPAEVGLIKDDQGNVQKLEDQDIYSFAELVSYYAPCYIIEDKENFFKHYTSITKVRPVELGVFGPNMSNDVTLASQAVIHASYEPRVSKSRRPKNVVEVKPPKQKSVALLGGDFTGEYVLAIDTLLNFYDKIFLAGKLGIYFFMYKYKFNRLGDYVLDEIQKGCIQQIMAHAKELNKEIVIPVRFIVCPKAIENSLDWAQAVSETKKFWPLEPLKIEPDLDHPEFKLRTESKNTIEEDHSSPSLQGKKEETKKEEPKKEDPKAKKEETKKEDPKAKKEAPKKEDPKAKKEEVKKEDPKTLKKQLTPDKNLTELINPNEWDPTTMIIGYEANYINSVINYLKDCRSVLWIGSLEPTNRPESSEFNRLVAVEIYQQRQAKRGQVINNGISTDWALSCVGEDILTIINSLEIVPETVPTIVSRKDDDGSIGNRSDRSRSPDASRRGDENEDDDENTTVKSRERISNVKLLCDAYSVDKNFVLKMLGGSWVEAFETITSWDRRNEDDAEEDFSFLDEI